MNLAAVDLTKRVLTALSQFRRGQISAQRKQELVDDAFTQHREALSGVGPSNRSRK